MHVRILGTLLLVSTFGLGACSPTDQGDDSPDATTGTGITIPGFDTTVQAQGVPDFDSFTIGADPLFPEVLGEGSTVPPDPLSITFVLNNVESEITVRFADLFNNNDTVPDGQVVNFITSAGSIQRSCTTVSGSCSVSWFSGRPAPADSITAVILAYTLGTESFIDLNGDGSYDLGDLRGDDLGEPFLDLDGDGTRDVNEPFIDANGNRAYDGPDGLFNGVDCVDDCSPDQFIFIFRNIALTYKVQGT